MRYNKKGVSGVVTVLIIVALSLVAIGVFWAVIRPMIEGGTQSIDYSGRCIEIDLRPVSLACVDLIPAPDGNYECTVGLQRNAGQGNAEFNGVVAVFSAEGEDGVTVEAETGNIDVLGENEFTTDNTDLVDFDATKVKITPYINKAGGGKYICPGTTEYTNA